MTAEEERRWEEQQEIARLLTRRDAEQADTLTAAHLLAWSLAAVVNDDGFWERIRRAEGAPGNEAQYLARLAEVNWVRVLQDRNYVPPPSAENVADELIRDMRAVAENRQNNAADDLRRELAMLVQRLNQHLATPPPERNGRWWRKLRHLVGVGLNVLRHINLVSALADGFEAVLLALPGTWLATPGGPGAIAVILTATAVIGTVVAATNQVVKAIRQLDIENADEAKDAVRATMDGILSGLNGVPLFGRYDLSLLPG